MLIFDFETAYIGSANLTGAGIGMKSSNRRNFEAGILTVNYKQQSERYDTNYENAPLAAEPENMYGQNND